jgi:hypothetical protein
MRVLSRKASVAGLERERGRALAAERRDALRRGAQAAIARRRRDLDRLSSALGAHDPARTLARGYALVEDRAGEPLPSAVAARAAGSVGLRFHDGRVDAEVDPGPADVTPAPSDVAPAQTDLTPAPSDVTPPPADVTPAPSDAAADRAERES